MNREVAKCAKKTLNPLVILITSGLINYLSLTRGSQWLDDFAGYLLQAKSILNWNMADFIRHSTFTIQNSTFPPGPIAYPWGFPLLLVPIYAVFGLNPLALKMINLVFYGLFLILLYFLARTRLEETESLLAAGLFAFMPAMVAANDLILSDIPFLAVSTFSLLLIERYKNNKQTRAGLITPQELVRYPRPAPMIAGITLGAAIFGAYCLRTNGILLFVPLLFSVVSANRANWKKDITAIITPVVTFLVLFVLQSLLFPGGQSSYLTHFSLFNFQHLLENFWFYLWLPARTFDQIPGGIALYPLLIIFLFISMYRHLVRDIALYSYSLVTTVLFIFWPETQGLRFIYPVLPFLFIAAFDGMKVAQESIIHEKWKIFVRWFVRVFWGAILLFALWISAASAYQNFAAGRVINGPFDSTSAQLFDYLRANTPENSVMVFMRPRALRLFIGRDSFMTDRCEDFYKGDYVVIHLKMEDNGQVSPDKVTTCNPNIKLIETFRNKRFVVYRVIK